MQRMKPIYPDCLLKHGRESRRLTVQQVAARTGIEKEKYALMEAGSYIVSHTDAELLGALFKIKPAYIEANSYQVEVLNAAHAIMKLKDEKIAALTKALKRKIRSGK